MPAGGGACCEMAVKSKRAAAPAPLEQFTWPADPPVRPPTVRPVQPQTAQLVSPPAIPSMFAPGAWLPPRPAQSMAASSPPCWLPGVPQQGIEDFSNQGPWLTPPAGVESAQPAPTAGNREDCNLQA